MEIKTNAHFENISLHLKRNLLSANKSVKICVAWISWKTYNSIWEELINKGVDIELIYYDDFINKKNYLPPNKNIKLYPITTRFYKSLMHNKFCIIDDEIVITGSFNWSIQAYWHFENIIIVKNDFYLVKQFLHEFEDLKNYFVNFNNNFKLICYKCRSESYNLAVLGEETGTYNSSVVNIYNICWKHNHVYHLQSIDANFLKTYLGYIDTPDFNYDNGYDKYTMLDEFVFERNRIRDTSRYFSSKDHAKIDAVGSITIYNWNEHIEYEEDPDYVIGIIWKDMYKRKIIPDFLTNGDSDDIDEIIDQNR
jgi:hypothetical protein